MGITGQIGVYSVVRAGRGEHTLRTKRRFRSLLAAGAMVLFASSAQATTTNDDVTNVGEGPYLIESYQVGFSSRAFVQVKNATTGVHVNCGSQADLSLATAHPRFAQMYSAIQAAALSQRPVKLDYEIISSVCYLKRVQVLFN